ncbi:MAG: mannose-1-phosphate guanylyltransferase [Candidatus Zixiibacteriota bacterium]
MEHAVILAGGRGERFWPLSRRNRPKQLLPIISQKTMLEETIDRVAPIFPPERMWIVTGEEISGPVRERCKDRIPEINILAEPSSNNTCLAIGWAAVELLARDPEATMVVLSADHAIEPQATFLKVLNEAIRLAHSEPSLVTIGIGPTRPETGYGYIEIGSPYATSKDGIASYQVEAFREKPDRETAQEYYFDRRHLWNAGIFVWTAKTLLEALEKYQPETHQLLMTYARAIGTPQQRETLLTLYQNAHCISIDHAILELADNVLVIRADMSWDDVGSWLALDRLRQTSMENNVIIGNSVELDSFDMTVYNDSDDLVCTFGVSDLVVVRTDKVTFVAHKSSIPNIKKLIDHLKSDERWSEYL